MSSGQPSLSPAPAQRNAWKRWFFVGCLIAMFLGGAWWSTMHKSGLGATPNVSPRDAEVSQISFSDPDTLNVPQSTVRSMRLATRNARVAVQPSTLKLTGWLWVDPNELVHVNTRFPGEVIKIGMMSDGSRTLRAGDTIQAGQLLAIIWSKEIGEKKSDLVDALSQLSLHEAIYKTLKEPGIAASVPRTKIDEMQRSYESDLIEVERLRRTLRSWRLGEHELAEIEEEAERFHKLVMQPPGKQSEPLPSSKIDESWAEIDIKSPLDGFILEKNLTVGEIVETDKELFQVANLNRLMVMANIYEEDIPKLTSLPESERQWRVRLTTNPKAKTVTGQIETIGKVVDLRQHTAVVQGWIDNTHGELRIGQFVEALISLPAQPGLVEVPLEGLIDDGPRKFVILALDDSLTKLERREVAVVSRSKNSVLVRGDGPFAIRDGDRILIRGVLELSSTLDRLKPPVDTP